MLDLSVANKKSLEVKISVSYKPLRFLKAKNKDIILNILPPMKNLVSELIMIDGNFFANTEKSYNLIHKVLQNNRENINIDLSTVTQMSIVEVTSLLTAYINFINEIQSRPN